MVIRLRMSAHDAHYGGDLVDGARMLGLFGDVATELLIRSDGDEGLVRGLRIGRVLGARSRGRFIEAEGRIVRFGKRRAASNSKRARSYAPVPISPPARPK